MNRLQKMTDERMLVIADNGVSQFEESAEGRLYRDNNRVSWSVGHGGKHIMKCERIHSDVVAHLQCNDGDTPIVLHAYRVTLDSIARVNDVDQRITRSLYTIGFSEIDAKGQCRPYLLTSGGKLQIQTATGERVTQLNDAIGLVERAFDKAEIVDDSHFWNTPVTRESGVTFNPVMGESMAFPSK